jgi:hypothetical protein
MTAAKSSTTQPEDSTIKKPAYYLIKHLTDHYKNHSMYLIKSPKPYQAIQKYYNHPFKIEKITRRFPVLIKRVSYWDYRIPKYWMQKESPTGTTESQNTGCRKKNSEKQ